MRTLTSVAVVVLAVGAGAVGGTVASSVRGKAPYFTYGQSVRTPSTVQGDRLPFDHTIVDWDVDGDNDLIVLHQYELLYYDNDGAGNMTLEATVPLLDCINSPNAYGTYIDYRWASIDAADMNDDGVPELVVSGYFYSSGDFSGGGWSMVANALAPWQPSPSRRADVNADGVVNSADLAGVLGAWGQVIPNSSTGGGQ